MLSMMSLTSEVRCVLYMMSLTSKGADGWRREGSVNKCHRIYLPAVVAPIKSQWCVRVNNTLWIVSSLEMFIQML